MWDGINWEKCIKKNNEKEEFFPSLQVVFRLSTVPNLKSKIKRIILIFFGHMVVDM
jgi:hypothetical protein